MQLGSCHYDLKSLKEVIEPSFWLVCRTRFDCAEYHHLCHLQSCIPSLGVLLQTGLPWCDSLLWYCALERIQGKAIIIGRDEEESINTDLYQSALDQQ